MAHLLAARYEPPARAQTQAKTAIAFFIASHPDHFRSIDGAQTPGMRGRRHWAEVKFRKVIAAQHEISLAANPEREPVSIGLAGKFLRIRSLVMVPDVRNACRLDRRTLPPML